MQQYICQKFIFMHRKLYIIAVALVFGITAFAQTAKPKLVVGLVVDQMRWDFLYKYSNQYGKGGFKRLLAQGFTAENCMIPYTPTYTAPGHACVYTGSVPAIHGIVGNNWFNVATGKNMYCTQDDKATTVGSSSNAGKMSPANLWTTTVTDELRLSNNFKSKVIGIALKDRGAILPAGHSANAAYWYDAGKWITSTHYMEALPAWVQRYNDKDVVATLMKNDWDKLPGFNYDLSTADDKPYENTIKGEKTVTFPHKLSTISDKDKYEAFRVTPYANTFTFDFAKLAIGNEQLGKSAYTDFLAVSISSTDYIGHAFGPNSIEIQDCYLRLDKDIEQFLQYLDAKVGVGNYLFFLSADHGVAHIPGFLQQKGINIPSGVFSDDDLARDINLLCDSVFGIKKIISGVQNYQVYLNDEVIQASGKEKKVVMEKIVDLLKHKPFVVSAFILDQLAATTLPEPQKSMLVNGYNPQRSGDIQFTLKPAYFDGWDKGTTHGLWNPYDAHIPCVFFGWGVKPGKTYRQTHMTDIAATIAAMLQIQMPNGCVGKVITEVMK
jgi:predicted AlkP superfamily pyrophosphatase or phosphodiesterase